MFSTNRRKSFLIYALVLIALVSPLVLVSNTAALAQTPGAYEEVAMIETQHLDLPNPTSLTFSAASNAFFILPAHPTPQQPQNTSTIASFEDLIGTTSAPTAGVDPLNMTESDPSTKLTPSPGRINEFSFRESVLSATLPITVQATLVRTTLTSRWSRPSPDPMGIGYLASSNSLLIVDSELEEEPAPYWFGNNVFETSLSGNVIKRNATVSFSRESTGIAENPANGHYFISDDNQDKVFEVDLGADGLYHTSDDIITSFSTAVFGSFDAEGVAFDSWQGHLYVVGGANTQIYHITPGANGHFDGIPPIGDDQVTNFNGASMGLVDPEGITFNSDNGHLYILSGGAKRIAETTSAGALIRTIDVSFLSSKKLSDLAYAPASNNSGEMHLYIVDRGIDNSSDPLENDGKMYEIAFPPLTITPSNSVAINGPPTGVAQVGYNFTATVSPATTSLPLVYTWQASGQAPVTKTNNLSDTVLFTWDTPGTKTITVTVNNGAGTPVTANAKFLIMTPSNSVAINGPPTGVAQVGYNFTATVSPATTSLPLVYTWQASGQAPVTKTNNLSDTVLFTWDTPGTKTITVTVNNGAGTPVTANAEFPIMTPSNSVAINGPPTGVAQVGYNFTATVSPATTSLPLVYTWQASGQAPVTNTNNLSDTVLFTWDTPGTKTITVTVNNGAGTPVTANAEFPIMTPAAESKRIYLPVVVK